MNEFKSQMIYICAPYYTYFGLLHQIMMHVKWRKIKILQSFNTQPTQCAMQSHQLFRKLHSKTCGIVQTEPEPKKTHTHEAFICWDEMGVSVLRLCIVILTAADCASWRAAGAVILLHSWNMVDRLLTRFSSAAEIESEILQVTVTAAVMINIFVI